MEIEVAHMIADYLIAEALASEDGHDSLFKMIADRLDVPEGLQSK